MSVMDPQATTLSQSGLDHPDWNQVRRHLEQKKELLYAQIGNYPPPIAACDQQFNYLLEQQKLVMQELARLHDAEAAGLTSGDSEKALAEFVRTSTFFAGTG